MYSEDGIGGDVANIKVKFSWLLMKMRWSNGDPRRVSSDDEELDCVNCLQYDNWAVNLGTPS